mmetsp:Transcript_55832/g.147600  ORF Transcript_55832/g.147600 Transcript_55832/m.147600 type:complete len:274 (+) Transcript_55832:438-1259(+)
MHVVRALVGVDGLEVAGVPHDVVLVGHAVAAQHVAGLPRDVERLAARVALQHADELRGAPALVHEAADPQHRLVPQRDLGAHVGELALDQLVGGERSAELPPREHVLARRAVARLRRAQRAPRDAVARAVEAAEGAPEPLGLGQQGRGRGDDAVEGDGARGGGAQRELALDLGRCEARHAALEHETADVARVVLGPHDEDVGDGRVGDPHLGARQDVAAVSLLARTRRHAAGVGSVVGLGEAEAADELARGKVREQACLLLLRPVRMDREHDE